MTTKTKGLFRRLLGVALAASCVFSGTVVASAAVTTAPEAAVTAPAESAAPAADASTFSWDNATVYFLLTDRFNNGDTSNDAAYGRMKTVAGDNRATFHGGDFKGITDKINDGYFTDLGVNAIWLTAPYEQLNGYILGDGFAHYSYHGYYVTDYTEPDDAYGTKAEFQTMVDTAHEHGIRIIMDIVMNHAGYNNMIDMNEYNYGTLLNGWESVYNAGNLSQYHSYIDYETSATDWGRWWGSDWVRSGLPGYSEGQGGSELTQCLTGLPDFKTESSQQVSIPQFLQTKWQKEGTLSEKMAKYGSSNTVTGYISTWLAEWVETYGIDGFRCDTAKHVDKPAWKQLKTACVAALKKWKQNNPTKKLDDLEFWMTGEHWDHGCYKDAYFTEGGFDSMINFETQGGGMVSQANVANTYAGYASKINTDDSFNVLSYVSSHDSVLARPDDMYALGSAFLMLPGAVQIFYGDETARPTVGSFDGNGGAGHSLRSDMPWSSLNTALVAHWGTVGRFRNSHVAVGGGANTALTASSGVGFGRTYDKNGVSDKVAGVVYASNNTDVSVDVSALWSDGTQLHNYYDDSYASVSGGKVTFNSGAHGTILIEEPSGPRGVVTVTHIDQDSSKTLKTETISGGIGESYTTSALTLDGFTVARVAGNASGTFTESPIEVTYYYTFDSDNYAYIVVKYVDATSNEELAESETMTKKVGTSYSVAPKDIKNYEVDLTKTNNASGTVAKGTTTVTFKYNFVQPTNLKVHYYNANGWSTVKIYAYDESGATVKEYTGAWASAANMTAEGDGWFVYDVTEAESATVIFHNGAGAQEPSGVGTPGYDCSGEVWIKNGKVLSSGKVKVYYQTTDGDVLATATLTGVADGTTTYKTEAKTFDGYTLTTTPSNATGVFTAETITVTYIYTADHQDLTNTSTISATAIDVGSSVTVTGKASGGTSPYQYAYLYKLSSASSYTTAKSYSTATSCSITLSSKGTYTVLCRVKDSDGTVDEKTFTVTVSGTDPVDPLTNKSTISATSITLGKSVTLTGKATGGTTPYKYSYLYKKASSDTYTVVKDFSTTTSCAITPKTATKYNFKVKVKDGNGTVKSKEFTVTVSDAELKNNSTISATSIALGKSLTITGKASGGTSPYQYYYGYRKSSSTSYTEIKGYSSSTTCTVTPKTATDYVVLVKVKDSKSKVVSKTFNVTVSNELTNNSTISATSISLGQTVTVTGKAAGGTTPYQYAVSYKKTTKTDWTSVQGYSTNATIKIKPASAVKYDVRIKVKDKTGKVVSKSFVVTVKAAELANNSTISSTSIVLGKGITLTGKASGGTTPYQFAYFYKKATSDTYTTGKSYSSTTSYTFTPGAAVKYNLMVKVKDNKGTIVKKTFTVTVSKSTELTNTSKISATTVKKGASVTVTCSATGGTTPYQYAVSYKKASSSEWTSIQGYSTTTSVKVTPKAVATYDVRVKVKDKTGKIVAKSFKLKST